MACWRPADTLPYIPKNWPLSTKNASHQSNKAEKYNKLRKYVANLAYSPLCAVVSPPSEYLWKTLTYWSPECLTAPSHSKHRWTKCANNYRLWLYNLFRIKLWGHYPNLTKFSQAVQKCLPINRFKSKLWYANPFQNASMTNERISSNFGRVAAQFS